MQNYRPTSPDLGSSVATVSIQTETKTHKHPIFIITVITFPPLTPHCARLFSQHCNDDVHNCQSDMNIMGAWKRGYTGKDVVVTILDDGIERNHPDLFQNYVSVYVCVCGEALSLS